MTSGSSNVDDSTENQLAKFPLV